MKSKRQSAKKRRPEPTVLLVDDDELMCEVMGAMLSNRGWRVTTVGNLKTAKQMIEIVPPDVVLLDLSLPDATPKLALRSIRLLKAIAASKLPKALRVVAITGMAITDDWIAAAKEYGADACIEKFTKGFEHTLHDAIAG